MQKYFALTLRLWKLLQDFQKDFYIQLATTIIQQLIGVGITLSAAKMLDALVTKNTHTIPWFIGIYFVASTLRNRIGYHKEMHALKNIDNGIQQFLEEYSFKKIFNLNASQYAEGHSAIKLQVINRGESAVEQIVSNVVLTILPTASQILFSIIAIGFYSKTIALWSTFTLVVVILWSNRFAKFHRPFVKQHIENWDVQKKVRAEAFQHLTLIKVLSAEAHYLKKYLANRFSILEYSTKTWGLNIKHGSRRVFVMNVSRVISTSLLFILAVQNYITVGAVYAIWSWINDAYSTIGTLVQNIRQMPLRFVELEKYLEIIDTHPLFNETGTHDVTLASDIVITDLSFSYPHGTTSVFDHISVRIPEKKITAFVGASGSGKSTIVKLLLRMYDYKDGSITLGGVELHDIDGKYLRKHIGYVEQHVDLFDDTLRGNILLGVEDAHKKEAEEKLEEIAKLARIDQFYTRLGEKRFDTIVGERGIKLSGGERQRIGIARAIIKNPEILIFDEATSSLDTENEKHVMDAIKDVSKGKTTIIIAHRLSTVKDADKIIVMDKGHIVGEGTHPELMESNVIYQNLVAHQV